MADAKIRFEGFELVPEAIFVNGAFHTTLRVIDASGREVFSTIVGSFHSRETAIKIATDHGKARIERFMTAV